MRGEYSLKHFSSKNNLGSPPHTWGTLIFLPISLYYSKQEMQPFFKVFLRLAYAQILL